MQIKYRLVQNRQVTRMAGVTLIELLIVVVIVGILASVAYPAYQQQVRKTRRADGKSVLLQTAQQLERCYTRFSAYNNAGCGVTFPLDSPEEYYVVTAVGAIGASAFTLAAAPQNQQASDTKCATLRLTSTGVQGSQGADTDANNCW
jgi:type IV pilus assembly protein PilE